MTEDLKAKIVAAVTAAVDTLQTVEKAAEEEQQAASCEPHKFGTFRLPPDVHIKGFGKAFE